MSLLKLLTFKSYISIAFFLSSLWLGFLFFLVCYMLSEKKSQSPLFIGSSDLNSILNST
jgi:hypothetical protein